MALKLQTGESLIHVATRGERAPDGTIIRNVKLYEIVSDNEISPRTGLTKGEEYACNEIVKDMATRFGAYMEKTHTAATK